jgi:hypothetical protein
MKTVHTSLVSCSPLDSTCRETIDIGFDNSFIQLRCFFHDDSLLSFILSNVYIRGRIDERELDIRAWSIYGPPSLGPVILRNRSQL